VYLRVPSSAHCAVRNTAQRPNASNRGEDDALHPRDEFGKRIDVHADGLAAGGKSLDEACPTSDIWIFYKDKKLPAKTVLRIAYGLANKIPSDTKLKFASSEGSLQFLRSLGFQTGRFQTNHPVAEKKGFRLSDIAQMNLLEFV
jgi:hypothetical protein